MYDGEQIDEYAQVVFVHPVKVFERVRAYDMLVFGVCPRRQRLNVVLEAFESVAHAFHLAALEEIGHLEYEEKDF